jgi:lysophospholipase L1-like esterase
MMPRRRALALALILVLPACGKKSGGQGGPTGPTEPTFAVNATLFYDENGNGILDATEAVRLPGIDVVVGSVTGKSGASGQATVNVAAGSQTVAIRTESVPAYYVPASPVTIAVPQNGGDLRLAMRLPIGDNLPNVYMGFGDSLTAGEGSSDGNGYILRLQSRLSGWFGRAQVLQMGKSGTNSTVGAARIPGKTGLANRPAYTLILYGTNDWNDQSCQSAPPASCYTIDSLRTIVDEVKGRQSIPVLATLPPVNPAVNPGRNQWHDQMNVLIKGLATSEGAILADLNKAFVTKGNLPSLFSGDPNGVHPNDAGYDVMAEAFFQAITQGRSASTSRRAIPLFLAAPFGSAR